MQKDPETGNFTAENDTVKIIYSFFGRNAPVTIDVYNKLNEPLYIDWKRSALIVNDRPVSYANSQLHISGSISASSIGNRNSSYSSGTINAVADLPTSTVFIPPHTHSLNTLLKVTDRFINTNLFGITEKKEIPSLSISGKSQVKIGEFTEDKSPLNFKSFLTLYTLNNNTPKYANYQHDFFISKVIATAEQPENFDFFPRRRGDFFYTTKATDPETTTTGVGIAALDTK